MSENHHMMEFRRDPEEIWACPCGFTARYGIVCSHRKGWKNRPACQGKIFPVSGPTREEGLSPGGPSMVDDGPPVDGAAGMENPVPITSPPGRPGGWEYSGDDLPEGLDPEEIARILNMRRSGVVDAADDSGDLDRLLGTAGLGEDPFGLAGAGRGGDGDGMPPTGHAGISGGDEIPEGDWRIVPPISDSPVSQRSESVILPPAARLIYDWARTPRPEGGGWHVGDGSFSAFVWDALFDHFRHCWRKALVIVDREEVTSGG